jgi:hypothetical protein
MNAALARLTQLIPPAPEPRNTDWDADQRVRSAGAGTT